MKSWKTWFTLAESVVSVALLMLVLYGAMNAYFSFNENSDNVRDKVRTETFSRYLYDLVDSHPPDENSIPFESPFYLSVSDTGSVSYGFDPSLANGETKFLAWADPSGFSHEIALVGTGSTHGKTFRLYRITAKHAEVVRTTYLTK